MSGEPVITESFYPGAVAAPRVDGRNSRARKTRAALLSACRVLMQNGAFRPSMAWICETADRCARSGFEHFNSVEGLHLEALQDYTTRVAIAARVLGDELVALSPEGAERVVRAVVLGRVT